MSATLLTAQRKNGRRKGCRLGIGAQPRLGDDVLASHLIQLWGLDGDEARQEKSHQSVTLLYQFPFPISARCINYDGFLLVVSLKLGKFQPVAIKVTSAARPGTSGYHGLPGWKCESTAKSRPNRPQWKKSSWNSSLGPYDMFPQRITLVASYTYLYPSW